MENEEFMKQFSGSASANIVTVLAVGVILLLKKLLDKKCKNSHCKDCCFELDIEENSKSTSSDEDKHKKKKRNTVVEV